MGGARLEPWEPRGVLLRVAHGKPGPELTAPFTRPQASGPSALRVMTHLSRIRIAGLPWGDVPRLPLHGQPPPQSSSPLEFVDVTSCGNRAFADAKLGGGLAALGKPYIQRQVFLKGKLGLTAHTQAEGHAMSEAAMAEMLLEPRDSKDCGHIRSWRRPGAGPVLQPWEGRTPPTP